MVDPITLGSSLALTGFGVYLLNRYRKQRLARLRALALLQKYSTSSRIALHEGRMRLLVSMPQVHQLPENEQAAWRERDERRDRNYLELDLIQPLADTEEDEAPDEEERQTELEARSRWMEANESPLQEHVTLVAEEHIGSGVVVATEADEEHEVNIDERLEREGGASGEVQISLAWNDFNDLDLHLFCPSGERIYFNNKRSDCGGELDVDMNVRPVSNTPVENVVWKGRRRWAPTRSGFTSTNTTESDEQSAVQLPPPHHHPRSNQGIPRENQVRPSDADGHSFSLADAHKG